MMDTITYRSNESNFSNLTTAMIHFEEETAQMEVEKFNMENIGLRLKKNDDYYIEIDERNVSITNSLEML